MQCNLSSKETNAMQHGAGRFKIVIDDRLGTGSEQEDPQRRVGGAASAAEVGAEEQERDGEREQVVERSAVGRGVRRHHASAAGCQPQQHAHQRSGERLLPRRGAPLLRPEAQRGGAQEEGPVAPVVGRRNEGGAGAFVAARRRPYRAPADTGARRRACDREAARVVVAAVAVVVVVVVKERSGGAGWGEDGRGSCHPAPNEITARVESTTGQGKW